MDQLRDSLSELHPLIIGSLASFANNQWLYCGEDQIRSLALFCFCQRRRHSLLVRLICPICCTRTRKLIRRLEGSELRGGLWGWPPGRRPYQGTLVHFLFLHQKTALESHLRMAFFLGASPIDPFVAPTGNFRLPYFLGKPPPFSRFARRTVTGKAPSLP
jgi:hypothetical protein